MQNDIDVSKVLLDLYNYKPISVNQISGYDDLNFVVECIDLNSTSQSPAKYILKIVNINDSKKNGLTEGVINVMRQIPELEFEIPKPVSCLSGNYVGWLDASSNSRKVVLISYISGLECKNLEFKNENYLSFCHEIGMCAGSLAAQLFRIKAPAALNRVDDFYIVQYMHCGLDRLKFVDNKEIRDICSIIIQKFKKLDESWNDITGIRKGVIHNDMCIENFIYRKISTGKFAVKGAIDFSDMAISFYVYEAAIPIASIMYQCVDETLDEINLYDAAKATLSGFEEKFPLTNAEKDFLFYAVLGRCVSLRVMGGYDVMVCEQTAEHEMHDIKSLDYLINLIWKDGKNNWDVKMS